MQVVNELNEVSIRDETDLIESNRKLMRPSDKTCRYYKCIAYAAFLRVFFFFFCKNRIHTRKRKGM